MLLNNFSFLGLAGYKGQSRHTVQCNHEALMRLQEKGLYKKNSSIAVVTTILEMKKILHG